MIIAVNTRFPAGKLPDGYHRFITGTIAILAGKFPQHQFIYIAGPSFNGTVFSQKNIRVEAAGPDIIPPLLRTYWYQYKLPALLRKLKADMYFSADGTCALRTRIKQACLVADLDWLLYPKQFKNASSSFYKKNQAAFTGKADPIICFSHFIAEQLTAKQEGIAGKTAVIPLPARSIFKPVNQDERDHILETYTGGKEYFLFAGPISTTSKLMNLLKAFSFFKKRQKSHMQLIIADNGTVDDAGWLAAFPSYKYRNEVVRVQQPAEEELARLTAGAYAFVTPAIQSSYLNRTAEAMQCGVPVICSNSAVNKEWFGDAALYINGDDVNDLAQNMMLVFKDEDRRNELITAGHSLVNRFDAQKAAAALWDVIFRPAN